MKTATDNDGQRTHRRLGIRTDVIVTLLYPEVSFEPRTVRGIALDISPRGTRVRSSQLGEEDWRILSGGLHYAELSLELPFLRDPLKARATVRWARFHPAATNAPPCVEIGLEFISLPEAEASRLRFSTERLAAESDDDESRRSFGIVPRKLR